MTDEERSESHDQRGATRLGQPAAEPPATRSGGGFLSHSSGIETDRNDSEHPYGGFPGLRNEGSSVGKHEAIGQTNRSTQKNKRTDETSGR